MKYEYRCNRCPLVIRSDVRADALQCPECKHLAQRQWGFAYKAGFREGYNPALGQHISSRSQLQSALSVASDRASQPTSIVDDAGNKHDIERPPHHYVPVDMRDKEALGVTSEGLDSTYDAL